MQRLRIVIALAVLLGFSLPHCAIGGFLLPKAIAAAPTVEHHHAADDAQEYQSMHHSNHDCCDGCITCPKEAEYTPPNREQPIEGLSATVQENEPHLEDGNIIISALSAIRRPLYEQACTNARSIVKLE